MHGPRACVPLPDKAMLKARDRQDILRFVLLLTFLGVAAPSVAQADDRVQPDRRFFLFVTPDPPLGTLVETAWGDGQKYVATVAPETSRELLSKAYPRLFDAGRAADVRAFEVELSSGVDAHYNAAFAAAEGHLQRAMDFAFREPEALTANPEPLQRLVDAAALRYKNALAMKGDPDKALAELEKFARRFPSLNITSSDHPPNIVEAWDKAKARARAELGSLTISAHPIELDRSGDCALHVNGVRYAALPLAGPVQLPHGSHQIQVRCGNRSSWLQNVDLSLRPLSLIVPVRAMLGARGDFPTGGLVLVAPAEGDASSLVTAVSQATGLDGAVVVRAAVSKIELGRQDVGTAGPSREAVGRLEGDSITSWATVKAGDGAGGVGVGPWQWVAGGVGAAALVGGAVANALYISDYDAGKRDNLDTYATVATIGYVAGGALLATSVILFIVDASSEDGPGSTALSPSTGGGVFTVHF